MIQRFKSRTFAWLAGVAVTLVAGGMFIVSGAQAQNKEPIKIGFGQSLTGFLSPNGKQALLGMEIWGDRINKAGGLLGRQVQLVYYDDKSSTRRGARHLHQAARRRQSRSRGFGAMPPTKLRPRCRS